MLWDVNLMWNIGLVWICDIQLVLEEYNLDVEMMWVVETRLRDNDWLRIPSTRDQNQL
jgi:hypothetical protein